MHTRQERVLPEPDLREPHATVSVRHCILGTKVRIFQTPSLFQQVYDWVGSLNAKPKYFELISYEGRLMAADKEIHSGTYNMVERDSPILMSPTGIVSFKGYKSADEVIMVESPKEKTMEDVAVHDYFLELEKLKNLEAEKYTNEVKLTVSRENVYSDLIGYYSKRHTVNSKVSIYFEGEDGCGDGVSKDAFSEFFVSMYRKMEGCTQKVPMVNYEEAELEIVGKIITHAFLLYNIFPLQLSKCALKFNLYESVADDDLVDGFMQYLPSEESEMLTRFKNSQAPASTQPIFDILSDYSIFTVPTKSNIIDLCKQSGKIALIKNPRFAMQSLIKGMGTFWNKISDEQIDALYFSASPKPENIIKNLITNETTKQESKIVTWLHRYIRCCNKEDLATFLRFITGSTVFTPSTYIKLEFVDQPLNYLHPQTQTCFKILLLPRQYSSFTMLKDNIKEYMDRREHWVLHD